MSRRRLFRIAAVIGMMLSVGTVSRAKAAWPADRQQPAAASPWRVTLRISGGLLGIDQQLTLDSTGDLRVTDPARPTVAKKMSAAELAQIASRVAEAKPLEDRREFICNDCPQYDLTLQAGSRSITASVNYLSLAGTPIEPLVKALEAILARELPQEARPAQRL